MDVMWNFISRLKAIWKATSTRSPEELARSDSISAVPPIHYAANNQQEINEELQHFRLLVGIVQDRSFGAPHGFDPNALPVNSLNARPAPNMGIYTRVYTDEIKCKKNYKFASRLINICLGVQIIVAAALTALGAANKNGGAITTFGAINTVIAGFLTYLKGSGLPHRIKYFQHEWSKVREYIEQRERDLQCGIMFDVLAEVQIIRNMYEAVKQDVEANRPDRFVGVGAGRNFGQQGQMQSVAHPPPVFGKSFSDATSSMHHLSDGANATLNRYKSGAESRVRSIGDLEKGLEAYGKGWFNEKQGEANTAIHKAQGFGAHMFDEVKGLKGRLEDKMKEVGHLEKELEAHSRSAVEEKKRETKTAFDTAVREAEDLGRDIESHARTGVAQNVQAARDSYAQGQNAVRSAVAQQQASVRDAVTEHTGAAMTAISHGQAAAQSAISQRADAARAAVAESEAAARSGAHEFIDQAFADGRRSVSPQNPPRARSP